MKLRFKLIIILYAIPLLLSGKALISDHLVDPENQKTGTTDSVRVIHQRSGPKIKLIRSVANEDSIYTIDTKEERFYNNFLTHRFFSRYNDLNFRKKLVEKGKNLLTEPFLGFYILVIGKAFRFPVVFFLLALILILIGNVFFVIVILFVTNLVMNVRSKRRKKLRNLYEKILTDLMLQVIDTSGAIRILSKSKLKGNRNLLIDVLTDFQKSFRGDADRQIVELYQEMELGKISYNKTFSLSFYQQVIGIRELANMHPSYATEMIASRLNDPNEIVRTEAQICYPQVNRESPFDFLDILEKPFSKWAQLNIYYFIKIHEMPVPSFDKWLKSDHQSVVNFCILMIALSQQQESSSEIILLLHSPHEATRFEAIRTCGELHLFECKQELKDGFQNESLRNQIEIMKVFYNIGDEGDFQFVESTLRIEDISLRLEACRTMINISPEGINRLAYSNETMNFILTPFIEHIKDPRN